MSIIGNLKIKLQKQTLSRFGCYYCKAYKLPDSLYALELKQCSVCKKYTCQKCSTEDHNRGLGSQYRDDCVCKHCVLYNKEGTMTAWKMDEAGDIDQEYFFTDIYYENRYQTWVKIIRKEMNRNTCNFFD